MSGDEIIFQSRHVTVRRAHAADNEALCEVVRRVHLRSQLDVTQERDPDFFALPRMHLGEYAVYLGVNAEGFVGGCGSVMVRPGWVDGEVRKVGYLSDLRAVPGFKGARALPAAYHRALELARDEHGAELFYTVIFDDNAVARRALVGRGEDRRRAGQPVYRVMTPFTMTSLQFALPMRGPRGRVRRAKDADRDALVDFLSARARRRVMGDVMGPELFARRLEAWPDFGLESFFIATDGGGRIVGAAAPWNTHRFKRTRVLGYDDGMERVKRAFNLGARLLRYPPLPEPGGCLDFAFLSHLEVEDDDPSVLRDLLRATYRALWDQRLHFISAMIPRGSPLEAAFKGFVVNRTPMTVYSVALPESPFAARDFTTLAPGFEMALSCPAPSAAPPARPPRARRGARARPDGPRLSFRGEPVRIRAWLAERCGRVRCRSCWARAPATRWSRCRCRT